jgi:hypothetical protein
LLFPITLFLIYGESIPHIRYLGQNKKVIFCKKPDPSRCFLNPNHGYDYGVLCYVRYDHAHECFPPRYGYAEDLLRVYVHANGHEDADGSVLCPHGCAHAHVREYGRGREGMYDCDDDLGSWHPPV